MKLQEIRNKIVSGDLDINSLGQLKESFFLLEYYKMISNKTDVMSNLTEIENFLMICLDYYTYSESGDTLISDHEFDMLMNKYCSTGKERIIWADSLRGQTTWSFIKHKMPGMVGSVNKIYTYAELDKYLASWRLKKGYRRYIIAPKFDGVSSCAEINNNDIVSGATRYDGYQGQNITEVVRGARNSSFFDEMMNGMETGFYKCELLVTQSDFDNLIQEKRYANRRSATTGIINTPKNLNLARYITIIPLAFYDGKKTMKYLPPDSYEITATSTQDVLDEINKMLQYIRSADYDARTDGVILFPLGEDVNINYNDIMSNAIAYKVNTEEAYTTIEYGYVSVGKLGYAIPMIHVKAVEVNETIVRDVSLGSFDKYAGMDLHEGEKVIVFSAGNVIPQMRVPEEREYKENSDYLKIKKRCPYCDEKLTRISNEYKCTNDDCAHVKAGFITNFITKLKVNNIADGTIDALYLNKLVTDIPSIFELKKEDISALEGFGETSAEAIVTELRNLKNKEIPVSVFIGALGIPDISEKKCRNIFKYITLKDLFEMSNEKLLYQVINAEKTGLRTAEVFVEYIKNNRKLIKNLSSTMNIVKDIKWKGNICFTGFRDPKIEAELNDLHYEVSDSVNNATLAVVAASYDPYDAMQSGKIKSALKKGLNILQYSEIETLMKELRRRRD